MSEYEGDSGLIWLMCECMEACDLEIENKSRGVRQMSLPFPALTSSAQARLHKTANKVKRCNICLTILRQKFLPKLVYKGKFKQYYYNFVR